MLITKRAITLGASLMALCCSQLAVAAQEGIPPATKLQINEVFLVEDDEVPGGTADTLSIIGSEFDFGEGDLTVKLSGTELEVLDEEPNWVRARLPADVGSPGLPAGDYLLSVYREGGQSQSDQYDLTLGAVGPQGPQGEQGPPGPQGEQGDQGPPGPVAARSGVVARDGTILTGTGFAVTKVSTGHYRILYNPSPFTGFAVPVVTSFEGNAGDRVPYVNLVGSNLFEVKFFERITAAPTLIDSQFTFIVLDSNAGAAAFAAGVAEDGSSLESP